MTIMLTKGSLVNEYGEVVGRYWYRSGRGTYTIVLYHRNKGCGWTEEGVYRFAASLGLTVEEDRRDK